MDIDVVILWVDGNDKTWLEEKKKYQLNKDGDSDTINRYRDWGLLPYWFRAIEKFAPWIRQIHFVTWGHIPAFLNVDAPKLHIVRHDEFIPEKYLPTFSSHAIEMNMHRIPNLAEHFIYFNDDMFLLKSMKESDFFVDGLPCTYGGEVPLELEDEIGTWQHAVVNNMGIVNKNFNKRDSVLKYGKKYVDKSYRWQDNIRTRVLERMFPNYFYGFKNLHSPNAYLKETFEEIWEKEYKKLDSTCSDKFRTSDNVNQWVALWWQIASGKFSPYVVDNLVMKISAETIDTLCDTIENSRHAMICINDPEEEVDFERLSVRLKESFERLLPEKSQFEV